LQACAQYGIRRNAQVQAFPVREVALLSGYYDPDYFCRLFRAQTGMTPTAYQKKHTAAQT